MKAGRPLHLDKKVGIGTNDPNSLLAGTDLGLVDDAENTPALTMKTSAVKVCWMRVPHRVPSVTAGQRERTSAFLLHQSGAADDAGHQWFSVSARQRRPAVWTSGQMAGPSQSARSALEHTWTTPKGFFRPTNSAPIRQQQWRCAK